MYVCDGRASRKGREEEDGRAGERASFAALQRRDDPVAPADAPLRVRASQVPREAGTEGTREWAFLIFCKKKKKKKKKKGDLVPSHPRVVRQVRPDLCSFFLQC